MHPSYTSKPNIVKAEQSHLATNPDNREMQERLYGLKQNRRDLDPDMGTILSWGGQDPPVKSDFTSNKHAFAAKTKINKMGVTFISEAQDNYRQLTAEYEQALMKYV